MGPSSFLLAEQSTMTTESGSDSESKPEQEAEPQEAAGPQGLTGAQPGPEEQRQALEQFAAAAAHSTPVKKEVSPPGTHATLLPCSCCWHCPENHFKNVYWAFAGSDLILVS